MTRSESAPTSANGMSCLGAALIMALASVAPGCAHLRLGADAPALEAHDDELAVLTYNVFGFPLLEGWQRPSRFGVIKEELRSTLSHVDVVMLQEAFIPPTRVLHSARRNAIGGACGDRPFNPTGLVLLSDHAPMGDASSFAFVRDDEGKWRMRAERELDCDALAAQRRPLKGLMALTLSTPKGPVDVVNVHLDVDPGARHAQKRLIARFLAKRESEHPLVVAGDLNEETCRARTAGPFSGSVALEGASCGVGPTVGGLRLGIIQGALFPAEIDSVYVCGAAPTDKRARVFSSPRAGGHLSDHDGVLTFVRLKADAALPCGALVDGPARASR